LTYSTTLADAINKIGFGLVIYSVAIAESSKNRKAVA
jgi:sensory rhodopsin